MGQPVSAGSAYGLRPTVAWPVTWPAPLKSRYVTWGALQVLYALAFAFAFGLLQYAYDVQRLYHYAKQGVHIQELV